MPSELSVKQQRDARRAEKVAALKKQQATSKRNRLIAYIASGVGVLAIGALIVTFVVTSSVPKVAPADIQISGLKSFTLPTANHVDQDADASNDVVDYQAEYGMSPPAGGDHWAGWLNCGVYDQPVEDSRAVHDLEHGAVWVTYDPTKIDADGVKALRKQLPDTYTVLSPYEGLPTPVVASAWGKQVQLTGVDDKRLPDFIKKFWRSADAPEPTAACTGGIDDPGRVA
ncbi:DUF3105 domain-containing protein [Glaciihabitans sp. dw_435]|uniref:DUF3105 domain-containing protein n=1 Tax=Glaciihabitans sp. dw_435 TaxID=2720081 RepID=UPI001BD45DDD|nr:DUF3105 domain-containing protein [Glaciihabitans sp. dw_435]